jgi:hypothetical protein
MRLRCHKNLISAPTQAHPTLAAMSASSTFKALFSLGRGPDRTSSAPASPTASARHSDAAALGSPLKSKKTSAWNAVKTALKITKSEEDVKEDGSSVFQVGDCTFETPEACVPLHPPHPSLPLKPLAPYKTPELSLLNP